jgi:hypothetical protein
MIVLADTAIKSEKISKVQGKERIYAPVALGHFESFYQSISFGNIHLILYISRTRDISQSMVDFTLDFVRTEQTNMSESEMLTAALMGLL